MDVPMLINGLVRQTTVLIAQLATTAGVRAPLAHVADEVFHDLAREIEAQGVGRKVVADMFGMALRSYQKKLHRLQASATQTDRTLWQAMIEFLSDGSKKRTRILERFRNDGEREVGAVLNDLIQSGLVYSTGRGADARYGLTSEHDRAALSETDAETSLEYLVWLVVFLRPGIPQEAVTAELRTSEERVANAVDTLIAEGRMGRASDGGLHAQNIVIPVGAREGWEAAVLDHFMAMTTAIAQKAASGRASAERDRVGGTTLCFAIRPGHPQSERVYGLLEEVRTKLSLLWDEVTAYNDAHPSDQDPDRVTFYFGQFVRAGEGPDAEAPESDDG